MLLDEDTLRKSSELDPTIAEWVAANPMPPLDWNDYKGIRDMMTGVSQQTLAMIGPAEASITEEWVDVPSGHRIIAQSGSDMRSVRDGFKSKTKVHRPTTAPSSGSPLIVFCYGGGFIGGDADAGTPFARAFVRLFGAVVVNISYRLAPENKFPVPQQDGIDNGKWIAEHAADLKADPSKGFIIGGISAGGTQTALITLASISEQFAHPVTGQWLCVPSLMNEETTPDKYKKYHRSLDHNKDAPILSKASMDSINNYLSADKSTLRDPLRFAVLNKEVPLSKLPPTFVQSDGLDPLRDDSLIYETMLEEAGVKTRINFYPGCPHAHFAFMPGLDITNTAVADIMTGMGWLLGKQVSNEQGLGAMMPPVPASAAA